MQARERRQFKHAAKRVPTDAQGPSFASALDLEPGAWYDRASHWHKERRQFKDAAKRVPTDVHDWLRFERLKRKIMGSEILLSVALVTCNRPESLRRCLSSLRQQSVQPFEIVISDDSDTPNSGLTREIALDNDCQYLSGPRRGLYANRNFVAQHCRGTHIRTVDDDHLLSPDHLAQCHASIEQDRSAIWTTGERGYLSGKLVATSARANQLHPSGVGGRIENPNDNWGISDGSTIYPSEVFARGFRMVESFGFGSSYLEFGAFLYLNGWKCRCVPGATVDHYASELRIPDPLSIAFACICYNRYFRPSLPRLVHYVTPHIGSWKELPRLFQQARQRWVNSGRA
jgi:glycosyltransferase involved in cell wall biosynthesis